MGSDMPSKVATLAGSGEPLGGWLLERPARNGILGTVGLTAILVAVALVLFVFGGYTPTRTLTLRTDTANTGTLDNYAEIPVTVAPGVREKLEPFGNAARAACTVFYGDKTEATERMPVCTLLARAYDCRRCCTCQWDAPSERKGC
jgi:hypothetical protein